MLLVFHLTLPPPWRRQSRTDTYANGTDEHHYQRRRAPSTHTRALKRFVSSPVRLCTAPNGPPQHTTRVRQFQLSLPLVGAMGYTIK